MVRRMTPSQFKSYIQQVESRQRQAVDRYNQKVRDHNRKVRTAIDKYNREVRSHNVRVRADRQRLVNALLTLNRRTTITTTVTRYVSFRTSVDTLHRAYESLEQTPQSAEPSDFQNRLLDLSERENANSLEVMNALLNEDASVVTPGDDLVRLQQTKVDAELREMSGDLESRWKGALFSLHPRNPDASRHFCTSAREIFTSILDSRAPDDVVRRSVPNCPLTDEGRPTRRAKIHFALMQKGAATETLEDFVQVDIDNILELFSVFNDGTHGSAGRFQFEQLLAIKTRVEDGIAFLHQVFV